MIALNSTYQTKLIFLNRYAIVHIRKCDLCEWELFSDADELITTSQLMNKEYIDRKSAVRDVCNIVNEMEIAEDILKSKSKKKK